RVEREDRRLVARGIEPAHDVVGRLSRVLQMTFHAPADVEQHRDAYARQVVPEVLDISRQAPVQDFEITRREIRDKSPLAVADDGSDPYHVDAGPEGGGDRESVG